MDNSITRVKHMGGNFYSFYFRGVLIKCRIKYRTSLEYLYSSKKLSADDVAYLNNNITVVVGRIKGTGCLR